MFMCVFLLILLLYIVLNMHSSILPIHSHFVYIYSSLDILTLHILKKFPISICLLGNQLHVYIVQILLLLYGITFPCIFQYSYINSTYAPFCDSNRCKHIFALSIHCSIFSRTCFYPFVPYTLTLICFEVRIL